MQSLRGRLEVLQQLVAELELDQRRLNKRNLHLEHQKVKLKRETSALRDALQQVRDRPTPPLTPGDTDLYRWPPHYTHSRCDSTS